MDITDLGPNPFEAFRVWLAKAEEKSGLRYPNAMALTTVNENGQPSTRMVLLKEFSEAGFVFYTNYESRKGHDLINGRVALCFFWDALGRQVRVEGKAEKVSRETSEEYFHTRPRGSQCGAWASQQSKPLGSRRELEDAVNAIEEKFSGKEVPLPPHWGGFLVRAERIEFWEECPSRLHDRVLFTLGSAGWTPQRLFP